MQEKRENITKTIHRLNEYITKTGTTFNKLALELGLSNSYFSKMVRNNGSIGSDIIENILRIHPDINADWLLTGRGCMLRNDLNNGSILVESAPTITPTSSAEESLLYKMYKEKDIEVGTLKEEIGALKLKIKQLEESKSLNQSETAKNVSTKKYSSHNAGNATSANAQSKE